MNRITKIARKFRNTAIIASFIFSLCLFTGASIYAHDFVMMSRSSLVDHGDAVHLLVLFLTGLGNIGIVVLSSAAVAVGVGQLIYLLLIGSIKLTQMILVKLDVVELKKQ